MTLMEILRFLLVGPTQEGVVLAMGPFAIAMIVLAVAAVASTMMMKKPSPRKPEAFEELDFPQFEEGTRQTVCFGDCWTGGWMVLWYGNYRTTKIKSGGKK